MNLTMMELAFATGFFAAMMTVCPVMMLVLMPSMKERKGRD